MQLRKVLVLFLLLSLAAALSLSAFAQDGAATYKAKCAACHGADGQGKPHRRSN
jgi:cytochrome c553